MTYVIVPQPKFDNPYVVDDYPYGYSLRTKIRYWVETTNRGQRFVRQTLNPKTGNWNKPKKTTYKQIVLAVLNEKDYVSYVGISLYSTDQALRFKERFWKYMSEYQKTELTNIIKMSEVFDKVEWSCRAQRFKHKVTGEITTSVPLFQMNEYFEVDDDGNPLDREQRDKEQAEINRRVNSCAVANAGKATSIKSALETFKRA